MPAENPHHRPSDPSERFSVPGAEILSEDTWADERSCPECGRPAREGAAQCSACGQWLEECAGSCPSCGSPRCVGGRRGRR